MTRHVIGAASAHIAHVALSVVPKVEVDVGDMPKAPPCVAVLVAPAPEGGTTSAIGRIGCHSSARGRPTAATRRHMRRRRTLFDPSYFDGDLAIINSMETTEMPTSTAVGSKAERRGHDHRRAMQIAWCRASHCHADIAMS